MCGVGRFRELRPAAWHSGAGRCLGRNYHKEETRASFYAMLLYNLRTDGRAGGGGHTAPALAFSARLLTANFPRAVVAGRLKLYTSIQPNYKQR